MAAEQMGRVRSERLTRVYAAIENELAYQDNKWGRAWPCGGNCHRARTRGRLPLWTALAHSMALARTTRAARRAARHLPEWVRRSCS